jgi:hypothetical protein
MRRIIQCPSKCVWKEEVMRKWLVSAALAAMLLVVNVSTSNAQSVVQYYSYPATPVFTYGYRSPVNTFVYPYSAAPVYSYPTYNYGYPAYSYPSFGGVSVGFGYSPGYRWGGNYGGWGRGYYGGWGGGYRGGYHGGGRHR